jgi:hypothetical protein
MMRAMSHHAASAPIARAPARRPRAWIAAAALLALATAAPARTVVLTAEQMDRYGGLCDAAPLAGYALREYDPGLFHSGSIALTVDRSYLFRFPLQIPPGYRIVYAELVLPVNYVYGTEPRFYIWRLLADWGTGVCHLYRATKPAKVPWAQPGARGISSDRAIRPTDIVRVPVAADTTVNVTEDVELWYTKAAPNCGWLLTVEDPGCGVMFESPAFMADPSRWRLRITYEPAGP